MANPSGKSATDVIFDASKQAKPPPHLLRSPPLPLPAVRIALVSPAVGYGLFAARDLAPDEFVFHEAPLLGAPYNEVFAADRALVRGQTAACRTAIAAHRDLVAVAYPALAARFGVAPPPWEEAARILEPEGGLGMNLVVGGPSKSRAGAGAGGADGVVPRQYAGSSVTRAEYEAYTANLKVSASVSEVDIREACLDFFKHYAFQVPPNGSLETGSVGGGGGGGVGGGSAVTGVASTREACVYLLGSLINHCCTPTATSSASTSLSKDKRKEYLPGPNCSWRIGPSGLAHFVKPRHICVQARRAIREGEQLTWDYGKREKGFDCHCDTCRDGLIGGLGSCRVS
ncbi:hypothetical protein P885DRAFT_66539 [Corynascus similis CBS 632.67]